MKIGLLCVYIIIKNEFLLKKVLVLFEIHALLHQ